MVKTHAQPYKHITLQYRKMAYTGHVFRGSSGFNAVIMLDILRTLDYRPRSVSNHCDVSLIGLQSYRIR